MKLNFEVIGEVLIFADKVREVNNLTEYMSPKIIYKMWETNRRANNIIYNIKFIPINK